MNTFEKPGICRVIAFIDGQNVFHCVREIFGHKSPNYNVKKLAEMVCAKKVEDNWKVEGINFYTGIPDEKYDKWWSSFWKNKLRDMKNSEITCISRTLKYEDGFDTSFGGKIPRKIGREKGIDVKIALDVIKATLDNACDVILIFSQDQDLAEVVPDVNRIACEQKRWMRVASAFPKSNINATTYGIRGTIQIPYTQLEYDICIDHKRYGPRS